MSFHITHDVFKIIPMGADDHVDMAGHDTITEYFKAFVFLAMFPTGNRISGIFEKEIVVRLRRFRWGHKLGGFSFYVIGAVLLYFMDRTTNYFPV